MVSQKKLSTF